MLDADGGIFAECSLRRAGDGSELVSAAAWRHDGDLLRRGLPSDGSATIVDRTRGVSTLLLTGPRSLDLLAGLTDGGLALH